MPTFKLFWSPEGKQIATVEAKDRRAAIRKAPKPYRKYLGEIYATPIAGPSGSDVVRTVQGYRLMYKVAWCRNGYAYVTSMINGALVGSYIDGAWRDDDALSDDVKAWAMECKP